MPVYLLFQVLVAFRHRSDVADLDTEVFISCGLGTHGSERFDLAELTSRKLLELVVVRSDDLVLGDHLRLRTSHVEIAASQPCINPLYCLES